MTKESNDPNKTRLTDADVEDFIASKSTGMREHVSRSAFEKAERDTLSAEISARDHLMFHDLLSEIDELSIVEIKDYQAAIARIIYQQNIGQLSHLPSEKALRNQLRHGTVQTLKREANEPMGSTLSPRSHQQPWWLRFFNWFN